jgi:hypothetical protein
MEDESEPMAVTRPAHPLAIDNGSIALSATDSEIRIGRIMRKEGKPK